MNEFKNFVEKPFETSSGFTLFTKVIKMGSSQKRYLYLHDFGSSHYQLINDSFTKKLLRENSGRHHFFDLIGHGSSSGARGDIESFYYFSDSLIELLRSYNEKVSLFTFGSSCIIALDLFRRYFIGGNKCLKEIFFVNPFFHSNKKVLSFLHEVELPESLKELYHLRLNNKKGTVLEEESLTWSFWRNYVQTAQGIGEGLYFIECPIKFIETSQSEKVRRTINALRSLLIHTKCEHIQYNNSKGLHI